MPSLLDMVAGPPPRSPLDEWRPLARSLLDLLAPEYLRPSTHALDYLQTAAPGKVRPVETFTGPDIAARGLIDLIAAAPVAAPAAAAKAAPKLSKEVVESLAGQMQQKVKGALQEMTARQGTATLADDLVNVAQKYGIPPSTVKAIHEGQELGPATKQALAEAAAARGIEIPEEELKQINYLAWLTKYAPKIAKEQEEFLAQQPTPPSQWDKEWMSNLSRVLREEVGTKPRIPIPEKAIEHGFTTPAFHGTTKAGFSRFQIGAGTGAHFGTHQAAHDRIDNTLSSASKSVGVYPVLLRLGKTMDLPDLLSWLPADYINLAEKVRREPIWAERFRDFARIPITDLWPALQRGQRWIRDLFREHGYDSIRYRNEVEHPGSYSFMMIREAPGEPGYVAGVRSPFAAFKDVESANIMGALGAMGLIPLLLGREREQ